MLDISRPNPDTIFRDLCERAGAYDRSGKFPRQSFDAIAACGLHARFAQRGPGHDRCSFDLDMLDWLRLVGRADLSVGRLFEGHVNAIQLIAWFGSPAQQRQLSRHLDDNKIYGVWATQPPSGLHLVEDQAGGLHLRGSKTFASGAGEIDFAIVTAQPADGSRRMVIVPANDPARADVSGWKVRGMRATVSGTYDLTGHRVTSDDLLGKPGDYDRDPRFTAGAWRFLAVQLGGIEALVQEMRHGMSDAAKGDPLARLKFADAVEAMKTAQLWVTESCRRFSMDDPDGPAFVRMARGVVEKSATDVMNLAARMIGTRSAFDGQRVDKIIRDLGLYLRQAGADYARDQAAIAWLERDISNQDEPLW